MTVNEKHANHVAHSFLTSHIHTILFIFILHLHHIIHIHVNISSCETKQNIVCHLSFVSQEKTFKGIKLIHFSLQF